MLLGVSRPWTIFRQLIRKFSFGYTYEECLCHGMRGRCHHGFMLQILCLFLWRHLENISALLLRRCFLSAFIIHMSLYISFSSFSGVFYEKVKLSLHGLPKFSRTRNDDIKDGKIFIIRATNDFHVSRACLVYTPQGRSLYVQQVCLQTCERSL